jgi:hypothetical protein
MTGQSKKKFAYIAKNQEKIKLVAAKKITGKFQMDDIMFYQQYQQQEEQLEQQKLTEKIDEQK